MMTQTTEQVLRMIEKDFEMTTEQALELAVFHLFSVHLLTSLGRTVKTNAETLERLSHTTKNG